ncbi:GPW/gp25 family protein [Massilia sp. CF038]|uniref:GPW/gp25 family protein n=1 Tax=Massilia sp. CF038 TaxID=1881045 RepID=UPI001C49CFF0|nr:GPW/gp25 family protein [Massilia sp. CF038]
MMNIDFPFHFDSRGRTASTGEADHIRDMIEQFLFTNAGERVNRPDFGSGLLAKVFEPNSPELATALQFSIQAGLQRWLGDLIEVRKLEVISREGTLTIDVVYALRSTGETTSASFARETGNGI